MRTLLILTFIGQIVLISSCKKKEDDLKIECATNISTSFDDSEAIALINTEVTFNDLSKGVKERTWTFPDGVVDILESANDATSDKATVTAQFTQSGTFEVALSQEYHDQLPPDENGNSSNTFDTNIVVQVLDQVKASFVAAFVTSGIITNDYLSQTSLDGELNEITDRRKVAFINTSVGSTMAEWKITRTGTNYNYTYIGDTLLYSFNALGKYNVSLVVSNPFGSDEIRYANMVEALANPIPFIISSLNVVESDTENDKIKMTFNRSIATPASNAHDYFTLYVTPYYQPEFEVDILSVSRDPNNSKVLWFTISEELYNSDSVFLSYDAELNDPLRSADYYLLPSFDSELVIFIKENLLANQSQVDSDFETIDWYNANWPGPFNLGTVQAQATNINAYSGNYSLHMVSSHGPGYAGFAIYPYLGGFAGAPKISLEAGDYEWCVWYHVNHYSPSNSPVPCDLRLYLINSSEILDNSEGAILHVFDSETMLNQWSYGISQIYEHDNAGEYMVIFRIYNAENDEDLDINIDHLELHKINMRP